MGTMTLYPYLWNDSCWVFDDPQTGLKEEAFVLGASEMISWLIQSKQIPHAQRGFAMSFSDKPFDHDVELTRSTESPVAEEMLGMLPESGNWYSGIVAGKPMAAWLCPALYAYFPSAPERIFVKAERLPAGIDPIWHIGADDPRAHRFMSADFGRREG